MPLYDEIYNRKNRACFELPEKQTEEMAQKHGCRFADNETPYERVSQSHPTIVLPRGGPRHRQQRQAEQVRDRNGKTGPASRSTK